MKRWWLVAGLAGLMVNPLVAQKSMYLREIKKAAEKGWEQYPAVIANWKANTKTNELWGYDAPAQPVYLAGVMSFLYEQTHDKLYARRAAELLSNYGDLRSILPKGYDTTRAEYAEGVPAIANFFFMGAYIRSYLGIRNAGVLSAKAKAKVEKDLAGSADFIFHFPEWGTHNRAMLRAEALQWAALAMPDHPHASRWRKMAVAIAGDSMTGWEIEDATTYHPVWLLATYLYAEASHNTEFFDSPLTKYYAKYFTKLIGPNGTIPEFGDGRWGSGWESLRFVAIFEKAASVFHDPEMKWAAQTIFEHRKRRSDTLGVGDAYSLSDAYRWADESLKPRRPTSLSQEVLEDQIGKKIVFRDGWDDNSTYLLLDYRDEGDGGWLSRDFLRNTISVEEEKMTHGHSDENSIPLLMSNGSVLLHDADYRNGLPSGEYGAWRADYFHNRLVVRLNKRDPRQPLLSFLYNSGAYRHVRTQKIDFLRLSEVDMSRTRVIDEVLGYQWDRCVTYVKEDDFFVVVDAIKILRSDYFTFANLWHGQNVFAHGENYFDIATDSIQSYKFSPDRSLLVYFPETYAKTEGMEPISRSWHTEHAVYQTISSQYKAGDTESFVTILIPHDRSVKPETLLGKVRLLPTSDPGRNVGLEISRGKKTSVLGIPVDLEREIARENIRPRYLYDLGKNRYGKFETDANFFFATIEGRTIKFSASNVLKVLYDGNTLFASLPNTHGLQLDGSPPRTGYVKWRYWEDTVTIGNGTNHGNR